MIIRLGYLLAPRQYLDPGTGSMLLQAILAGLAVVGGFLYTIRGKISKFFSKLFSKNKDQDPDKSE